MVIALNMRVARDIARGCTTAYVSIKEAEPSFLFVLP